MHFWPNWEGFFNWYWLGGTLSQSSRRFWLPDQSAAELIASIWKLDWVVDWGKHTGLILSLKSIGCDSHYFGFQFFSEKAFKLKVLTLIRESRKKNPKRGTVTERVSWKKSRAQHWINLYTFPCFGFFLENTLGHGPKKWHIFLFSTAYFLLYWHTPFEICTIV